LLKNKIVRKTIKQTVMTTVYNVTFYGAKLQVQRQLETTEGIPADKVVEASAYIAAKTFDSIRQLFKSARSIQDWFSECAYLASRVRNTPVTWRTPLGLSVIQPYYAKPRANDKVKHRLVKLVQNVMPKYTKQRNAFPPNFIHSLDSTHMMLTSLYCEKAGVAFVSVHDCFWTHACTADIMNRVCREQFVALHKLPLLDDLSGQFLKQYGFSEEQVLAEPTEKIRELMREYNARLKRVPVKGSFDLDEVLKSRYFFS
jgi:DNA-directed RNA polymerase